YSDRHVDHQHHEEHGQAQPRRCRAGFLTNQQQDTRDHVNRGRQVRPKRISLSSPRAFCQWPRRKIAASPIARTTPPTEYDQITVLGTAKKATTAEEFAKLPLTTIPFPRLRLQLSHSEATRLLAVRSEEHTSELQSRVDLVC